MTTQKTKGSGLTWFIRRGATVRGPFSSTRIRHFVLEGKLNLDDQVSADRGEWLRLGQVDEVIPLQMRDHEETLGALDDSERRRDRSRAMRSIAIVSVVIVALVGVIVLKGNGSPGRVVDCAADPAAGVVLEGCDLSGSRMISVKLPGARLANTKWAGAVLSESDLSNSDLRYADLSGADLSYAQLGKSVLKGANLRGADLTNANLAAADLGFADLSGAQIGGAIFEQAQLTGTIWTDGKRCEAGNCPR